MPETYNLYNLEAPFKQFLLSGIAQSRTEPDSTGSGTGIKKQMTPVSIKNYLSDVRHFFGWLILYFKSNKIQMESEATITQFITAKVISGYRSYLSENNIPHKTINRRLSTIRKFCSFCISQGWMKENPAKQVLNIGGSKEVINNEAIESPNLGLMSFPRRWESKLKSLLKNVGSRLDPRRNLSSLGGDGDDKTSSAIPPKLPLQYYMGFVIILIFVAVMGAGIYNQFFVTNNQSLAYPTALTKAGRILSFQGRLTDTLGNPITAATNVQFRLWKLARDLPTDPYGTEGTCTSQAGEDCLYKTGSCSVTPDQDGIFSSLIGSTCGSEIDQFVFSENPNVYLGITVGGDTEMTPRQQIANVGYAINSETLQGLPPGTGTSVIPYINVDGNLLISASNPGIRSTSASTDFTLSSAKATVIQSAGAGDVVLQATESGTLKFRTGGTTDANTRITVDNAGLVGIGTIDPDATAILDLTSTTKGFLAPRMTTTERDAISTPATGLMIYNTTDNQYNVFNGTTWGAVGGGGGGAWSDLTDPSEALALTMADNTSTFTYNAATGANNLFNLTDTLNNTGTGYLLNLTTASGSSLKPFHVSAAGNEALTVLANGSVGVGNVAPGTALDVTGTGRFSSGLTLTTGALNLAGTSGALNLSGLSASSIDTGANNITFTSGNFNTTATGINGTAIGATTSSSGSFTTLGSTGNTTLGTGASSINTIGSTTTPGTLTLHGATTLDNTFTVSGLITATSGLTANGALTANAAFTLGDNGDLGSVNTSNWDVSTTGAASGLTGISSSGNIDLSALSAGGLVKAAVTTGRLAIATAGTDYENPLTFSNGLTRTANAIKLGGTLTAATDIPLGGYDLTFSGTGNVGIGTAGPDAKLDSLATSGEQLRLTYTDGSAYTGFTVNSGGDLTIVPSGGDTNITGNLITTGATTSTYFLDGDNGTPYGLDPAGTTNFGGYSLKTTGGALLAYDSGNVGIGATSPGAKLHSLATTEQLRLGYDTSNYWSGTVGATGGLTLAGTGTGGSLTLTPTAGQNLNVNLSTTGDFAVNTNQLYVDTSSGNVGIGTTSPAVGLTVSTVAAGSAQTSGTAQTYGLLRLQPNNTAGLVDFGVSASGAGAWIQSTNSTNLATNYPLLLNPNGGNVGIGTTDPGVYKLNVAGTSYFSGDINAAGGITCTNCIALGTETSGTYDSTADTIADDGVIALTTETSGNYVAGLTAGNAITISGTAGEGWSPTVAVTANSIDDAEVGDNTLTALSLAADSVGDSELFNGGAWTLTSNLNIDSNTLVVDQANNRVGIGTTGPNDQLEVANYIRANGFRGRKGIGGAVSNLMNTDWAGACVQQWVDYTNMGNLICSSDQRVKTNIQTFTESKGLDAIKQLNPVTFNWRNSTDATTQYGFIAQEVEKIFPELVTNTGMKTDLTPDGLRTLYYQGLIPVAIKGIQEQQTQIALLRSDLDLASEGQALLSGQLADLALTTTGDLEIVNVSQTPYVYDGNTTEIKNQVLSSKYQVSSISQEVIDRIGAFSELMAAKIKTGLIETENAIVSNTLAAKNIVAENVRGYELGVRRMLVSEKIVSPVVETTYIIATGSAKLNQIQTNEIAPQNQDLVINLDKTSEVSPPPTADSLTSEVNTGKKGALARLIIKGLEGKSAVVIDAAGNASFSGQIIADSLTINNDATVSGNFASNTLTVNDASVSGKLIAKEIESSTINDIQSLLADIKNQPVPNPSNETNLSNVSNLESLTVTGNSNLYNVSVSNSLLVGTTIIDQNSIISLASELKLSALSTINLFDGAVIIAKDGTITTRGELIAEKGIRTDEIKPLTDGGQVTINNLAIDNLTINNISTNSAIIAAADNFAQNGIFAPAIETATASAGLGILPENSQEVLIYNSHITPDSLIYLTPTSPAGASAEAGLSVGEKSTGSKPYFKVVTNSPSTLPIKFNWLIIN